MTGPPVPFSDLPLNKEFPDAKLNAWGVYGDNDEKGFLNRQTDEIVKKAADSEIKTGTRISLNAPLDFQRGRPFFERQMFHKEVYQKGTRLVNDDKWIFNTQSSSQWDGFRHFAYQKAERFYNNTTMADIHKQENRPENFLGIQNFAEHGIVGRGILVDFERWRQQQSSDHEAYKLECMQAHPIKLSWMKEILKEQGTEVKFGDIFIIRSGWMAAYHKLTDEDIHEITKTNPPPICGVEQDEETLKWIWENFSAVAGDQPAFERYPHPASLSWSMHEVLLAGWGCPIGELFDLEKLAEHCAKEKRWSFFVTSEVVNVPGGVASPPNILAIF